MAAEQSAADGAVAPPDEISVSRAFAPAVSASLGAAVSAAVSLSVAMSHASSVCIPDAQAGRDSEDAASVCQSVGGS